ncbi:MAG: SDR family NAD(P)-dependent oxidoreductase, partial [Desulfobacterales bacterium]
LGQIIDYLSYATLGGEDGEQGRSDPGGGANSQPDSGHPEAGKNDLCEVLLAVVSDLTGYPGDMLGLDMDIEADLGIDSIKRVEILSTLEERRPDLPAVSPEVMGTLKTLGQIIDYLAEGSTDDTHRDDAGDPDRPVAAKAESKPDRDPEPDGEPVERNVVSIVEVPMYQGAPLSLAPGRPVYVTADHGGLSEAIVNELSRREVPALIAPEDMSTAIKEQPPAGLVILSKAPGQSEDQEADEAFLKEAFLLANRLAPDLIASGDQGGALFATISRLDGAFGFRGQGMDHPVTGGLAGLAKTAAIEWETVRCRAIDIAPNWDEKDRIARAVVSALLNPDPASPVEVGLGPNLPENYQIALELESCPVSADLSGKIDLSPGDVMIVTGGGRGITAACALALARRCPATFVLLGRSPQPVPEPEWIRSLDDEAAIKKAIIRNQFEGQPDSPRDVEVAFKTHMANREINRTLEQFQAMDAKAFYIPVDVRDSAAVASVMDDVRLTHGPIKGIIHGAGILADRLIIDKTLEQFEKVFDTKVRGLSALLTATGQDALKYLVIFSSISARLGNRGQVDYAMANEALNKIARNLSIQRPACNVTAINWGPWDGGMVSAALKKEFARNHIPLIPIDAGAESMVNEMINGYPGLIEVVIGGGFDSWEGRNAEGRNSDGPQLPAVTMPDRRLTQTFERDIDVDRHPVLASHIINKHPVVPFALMTEWIGHGALHENPGLLFCGLDEMRLLSGIKLDQEKRTVRLLAGKARKAGSHFEVDVEVRDGLKADGTDMIHYKAKAILADDLSDPPVFVWPDDIKAGTYARSTKEVYENILFQGEALRGIKEISSCSPRAMVASLSCAPLPEEWMADPLRTRWIGDPLVLDSAFQMAIIWCFEEKGMVSLPSYSACYRQYRSDFPSDGVTAVLEIVDATDHKMRGDYTFLDSEGVVVARLTGYEAIMDPSLHKVF